MSPQRQRDTKVWQLDIECSFSLSCQTFVSLCLCGDIRLNRPDLASWNSIRDALNVRRSGSDQFQLRWLFESIKKRPCNFVVNFCGVLKLKRITDHDFESALSEVKAAFGFRKIDSK